MPTKGYVTTEEHKKKIGNANRGRHPSEEALRKMREHTHSDEIQKKISKIMMGRPCSKETRGKMRQSRLGVHPSEEMKNKIRNSLRGKYPKGKHYMCGRHHSEETKKNISNAKLGRCTGINNHNWRGGISFEVYPQDFSKSLKESIRKRDQYRCQQCFRHQDELYTKFGRKCKLNIHHIDYNKKNNHPNNLLSLCRNCHAQTNYSRKQWTDYFTERIM